MKLPIPILLLCLTALGQPMPPAVANHATVHHKPLQTPKASTIQTASIMRKGAAVAVSGPMTNHVVIGGLIEYNSYCFIIQRASSLAGPWEDMAVFSNTNTPISWDDTNAPNPAFYRGISMPIKN